MPTKNSTKDAYNKAAKDWVKLLEDGDNLGHTYLEKPAIYSLLPDLTGKRVLCIGCGSGEECRYIKDLGASEVIGIDISDELVSIAKKISPDIEYMVMDMEEINFDQNSFDVVFSSLSLHYIENWEVMLSKVRKILKSAGIFLFSTIHTVKDNSEKTENRGRKLSVLGYEKDKKTGKLKFYGDYFNEEKKINEIIDGLTVEYYPKTISTIINTLVNAGFRIDKVLEPKPMKAVESINRNYFDVFNRVPLFILFRCLKGD